MSIKGAAKKFAVTLLVVAALILAIKVVRRTFFPKTAANTFHYADVGQRISLPGLSWPRGKQTILLALDRNCPYCLRSAPFNQKLLKKSAELPSVRIIAVLSDSPDEGRGYLEKIGLPVEEVRQADFMALGVRRTPTLLVVDDEGLITKIFVGMIAGRDEDWVLDAALNGAGN